MKKKFTVVLLTFLMSILCVLGLAACKNNDGTGDDGCEHSWGEWENTKEASCSEEGNRVHVCEKCGKSENETIEKIDHDFNSENICTVCGYELEITVGLEYEEYEEQVYCVKSMGYAILKRLLNSRGLIPIETDSELKFIYNEKKNKKLLSFQLPIKCIKNILIKNTQWAEDATRELLKKFNCSIPIANYRI